MADSDGLKIDSEQISMDICQGNDTSEVTITMLASLTTGFLARLPCHPIDTVKAKMQIQVMHGGAQNVSVTAKPHAHSKAAQAVGRLPVVGKFLCG